MIRTLLLLTLLTGCTGLPGALLSTLTNSQPGLAVEAQVGKENTKVVGISEQVKGDKVTKSVEANNVENINVQQTPVWLYIALILGWMLPSPGEMARGILSLFKRKT